MAHRIWGAAFALTLLCSLTACGTAGEQNPEMSEISESNGYESVEGT